MAYDHKEIEKIAREKWAGLNLYTTDLSVESKELYYLLVEFPYPSGDLHIGHWYAFAVTDIYARLLRAEGSNVLFPIGFDAFGLPAENAAIKNGADPKKWTYENMSRMREQLASMGASFDWSKEVVTCEPNYYQWTQWLFTKLFEHNLAEHREAAVKWCPKDQTVLANEQVIDGACERCGTAVEEKKLTQWFLKITDYAERLLTGLDTLPWREEIKDAQRAWIGKSEGAKLRFEVRGSSDEGGIEKEIEVFTTRPDTVFGATYVVLAPEHSLVIPLTKKSSNKAEIKKYVKATTKKTERERSENKEKTGVKLDGVMAINPATKEEIPIFIADYVLASYGTGAIMAVPAHDERDYEFAQKFNLPIRPVVLRQSEKSRSFVMGVSEEDMTNLGIEIVGKTDDGFFKVLIPQEKIDSYASFIRERMSPHFWNEFSTPKGFHFIFKHKDGKIEELDINADTNDLIDRYGMTFNDKPIQSPAQNVYSWLAENSFYKELLIHTDVGVLIDSGEFTGRDSEEAKWDIVKYAGGERTTQYRIRDWLVSRQRYWGCPIPIVYDPSGKPHAVPAEHLPWLLPTDVDFLPKADPPPAGKPVQSPLASSQELKERVTKIFGEGWTSEYDTLDTFVDSSWYFLRYLDTKNTVNFSNAELMKKWLPI
ncbi:MAG: class I tRNA ligase family protein, partial [bacterium]|nr:class I tRNA ligase family protein [bacterium]